MDRVDIAKRLDQCPVNSRGYNEIITDYEFLEERKKGIQELMDGLNQESLIHFEIKEGDKVTVFYGTPPKHGFAGPVSAKNCKPQFCVFAVKKDGTPSLNHIAIRFNDKIEKGWL